CLPSTLRAPPAIPSLSLPDALPISELGSIERLRLPRRLQRGLVARLGRSRLPVGRTAMRPPSARMPVYSVWAWKHSINGPEPTRSEEHTSELQSRENLVCRLLLEKK